MKWLETIFNRIGYYSARFPLITIAISILITAICSIGFKDLGVENDPQKIWVSPSSRSYKEQQYFNDKFGKFFRINQVMFKHKHDPSGTDIFQKEFLYELWKLQAQIEGAQVLYEDKMYTLDNYCYKPINGKGCLVTSPMAYWKMNITKLEEDPDIKHTTQCDEQVAGEQIVCSDRNEIPIIRDVVFGGISCITGTDTGCEACRIAANALVVTFLLNDDSSTHDNGVTYWESKIFADKIDDFNNDDSHNLKAVYMAQRSIPDELQKEANNNIWYVVMSYALMFLYVSIAIGEFPSKLHTRFLVGFGGIIIVIMSLIICIGVAAWLGSELTLISSEVVPFLILAIGVDNMFIISMTERTLKKKWRRKFENDDYDVPKIMGKTIGHVGPGIMAAAVSECCAFLVGCLTDIPALQEFCILAAAAVMVDFILQNTAFVSILALDNKRIKEKRIDIFPCFPIRESEVCPDRDLVKTFMRRWFAPTLFWPITQITVLIIFVCLAVTGRWAYHHMHLGLNEKVTLVQGSTLYNYFDALNKYGEAGPPAYIVFKNLNYTNEYNKYRLDKLDDAISQMNDTIKPPVYSWLKSFNEFTLQSGSWAAECNTTDISNYDFNTQVKRFIKVPIESRCCKKYGIWGEQYEKDIVFHANGEIKASRYRFQHAALTSQAKFIDGMRTVYHIIDDLGKDMVPLMNDDAQIDIALPNDPDNDFLFTSDADMIGSSGSKDSDARLVFPYSLFYIYYEQYDYIQGVALQNFAIGIGVVYFCVMLLTNLWAALIVTISVAGTSWGLLTISYFWNCTDAPYDIEINAVSVVNWVMCIGLAVEFNIHLVTYFWRKKGTYEERARKALENMGSTVLTGIAATKLIGVAVLGAAPSMIFQVYYFRMYLGIIFLGWFHGMCFTPLLLRYLGPPTRESFEPKKQVEEENLELRRISDA